MTCWRRCVARLLGVDSENVPDFVQESGTYWLAHTAEWLQSQGYTLYGFASVSLTEQPIPEAKLGPKPPFIAVGTNKAGRPHAIAYDADGLIWDPKVGGDGLAVVNALYFIVPRV